MDNNKKKLEDPRDELLEHIMARTPKPKISFKTFLSLLGIFAFVLIFVTGFVSIYEQIFGSYNEIVGFIGLIIAIVLLTKDGPFKNQL
jgi:hypothetical protein